MKRLFDGIAATAAIALFVAEIAHILIGQGLRKVLGLRTRSVSLYPWDNYLED